MDRLIAEYSSDMGRQETDMATHEGNTLRQKLVELKREARQSGGRLGARVFAELRQTYGSETRAARSPPSP